MRLGGVRMNWRGELVVRVGWRLTDRGLGITGEVEGEIDYQTYR